MNKTLKSLNLTLLLFLIFLNCLFIYLDRYFGKVSIDQLIFHINFSNNLLIDSDDYIVKKFFHICVYLPVLIILLYYFLDKILNKFINISNKINLIFILTFICLTAFHSTKVISFGNFLFNSKEDILKKYYKNPQNVKFNSNKSKNLVLIYAESFENILTDENIFNENLIKEIDEYNVDSLSFNNFNQTPLTNWTIAAIIATQCGLPLKNLGIFNFGKKRGKHMKQVYGLNGFLPKATCLGDILSNIGYTNIFISSPNTSFSGTGKFFQEHGYEEIYGKSQYDKLNINYESKSWGGGPNDSFLFEFSLKKIDKLIKKNKKFNLTLLTTDTHEPNGFHDINCNHSKYDFKSAFKCTSKNLYNFVKLLRQQYPNEIDIVILGDHLFRFGSQKEYDIPPNRTIFNKFIKKTNLVKKRELINHYDFFPSLLNFMSIDFNDNNLGLGVSAFKNIDTNEYINRYNEINKNIMNNSSFYETFWK